MASCGVPSGTTCSGIQPASCGERPARQSLAVGFSVCADCLPITRGRVFQLHFSWQFSFVFQFRRSILFVELMLLFCLLLPLSVSWFSYSPVCLEFSLDIGYFWHGMDFAWNPFLFGLDVCFSASPSRVLFSLLPPFLRMGTCDPVQGIGYIVYWQTRSTIHLHHRRELIHNGWWFCENCGVKQTPAWR